MTDGQVHCGKCFRDVTNVWNYLPDTTTTFQCCEGGYRSTRTTGEMAPGAGFDLDSPMLSSKTISVAAPENMYTLASYPGEVVSRHNADVRLYAPNPHVHVSRSPSLEPGWFSVRIKRHKPRSWSSAFFRMTKRSRPYILCSPLPGRPSGD